MGKGSRGDMRKAYDFWMPHLLVRRRGAAPLDSVFVVVYEPYAGKPFLTKVEPLPVTPDDGSAVALRVERGAATDTIIATLDKPPYPKRTAGGVTLQGRLGIATTTGGRTVSLRLFVGERLTAASAALNCSPSEYTGTIVAATRTADGAKENAFIVDRGLPPATDLHGRWVIVAHGNGLTHGYEIDHVERRGGKTVLVLTGDHGLKIADGVTKEVYFPHREIRGANTFAIPLAASLGAAD